MLPQDGVDHREHVQNRGAWAGSYGWWVRSAGSGFGSASRMGRMSASRLCRAAPTPHHVSVELSDRSAERSARSRRRWNEARARSR
jgi:hypothetical protein